MSLSAYTMSSGELRRPISLYTNDRTPDGQGGWFDSLTPVGNVWADVEYLTASQLLAWAQVDNRVTIRVVMRWRSGLYPGNLYVKNGVDWYRVLGVTDIGSLHTSLLLTCQQLQTGPNQAAPS